MEVYGAPNPGLSNLEAHGHKQTNICSKDTGQGCNHLAECGPFPGVALGGFMSIP